MIYLVWIISILILLIFGLLIFLSIKGIKKRQLLGSLDLTLFLIIMPKHEFQNKEMIEKEKGEETLIGRMEQIYSAFLTLKKPGSFKKIIYGSPRIAMEISSQTGEADISFYVAVPKFLESGFEKYVQGVHSRAIVEKIPQDYTIFEPNGISAGSYLTLKNSAFLPISTYKNLEKDPIATITNALSKITPDEGSAIQLVIRPLSKDNWREKGNKILNKISEGKSLMTAIAEVSRSSVIDMLIEMINVFSGSTDKKEKQEIEKFQKKGMVDERTIQAIQTKIQKQVFEVNIRLMACAQTQERADEILSHLEGAFGQFSLLAMNEFKSMKLRKRKLKKMIYDFSFRNFNPAQKNILNIEELTSIYHFPTHYTETPYIKVAKSGISAPPIKLPEKGLNLIGKTEFRGEEKNVFFASRADRQRHFYIIGQTGTGKSSLLSEMIRQDIKNGEGVAVIDPHGELIEDTLANIPKERIKDVILFEPFDLERPMGLNMLEYDVPEQKDFAVQEMIAIFYKLFPPEIIGPMFEHYMRNAMLALMADKKNPGTLVEISRMFTDESFLQRKLEKVTDPVVKSFWLKEWKQTTGNTKSEMLGYVVSKVGRFVENEMMRNIIGQPHCSFNLEKIMQEGKIFLANLSKGMTGEVNSSLLGLILVSKIQMAAMKQAKISKDERKDFYLYIDEFQNFTTDSIATILSEARKYKLNLILAHQYIPQLTEEIRDAVLGNIGTLGVFRIGANDAEFLEKQFEPEFSRFDLINLNNFNLIIKLIINNKLSSPFSMKTIYPVKGNPQMISPLKECSKLKYGKPKFLVEREVMKSWEIDF